MKLSSRETKEHFGEKSPVATNAKKPGNPAMAKTQNPRACPKRTSPCGRAGAKSRGLERRNLTRWKQLGRLLGTPGGTLAPGAWGALGANQGMSQTAGCWKHEELTKAASNEAGPVDLGSMWIRKNIEKKSINWITENRGSSEVQRWSSTSPSTAAAALSRNSWPTIARQPETKLAASALPLPSSIMPHHRSAVA